MDHTEETTSRRKWPWLVAGGALALLGVGYVGAGFASAGQLPATLSVEGVDVSGLTIEKASHTLEDVFVQRSAAELHIVAPDMPDEVSPAVLIPEESGFAYDVDATLSQFAEPTFHPVEIYERFVGEAHVSAVKTVDEQRAETDIVAVVEQLSFEPTEGSITYDEATMNYAEPVNGYQADAEELMELLQKQWLSGEENFEAPGDVVDPAVSAETWAEFVDNTAEPLVADGYTVTADQASTELSAQQLGSAATVTIVGLVESADSTAADTTESASTTEEAIEPSPQEDPSVSEDTTETGPQPELELDADALLASLAQNNEEFQSTAQNATVKLSGTAGSARPEVVPGITGAGVDGQQLVEAITQDLAGEQTRSVSVNISEVEPEVTTAQAQAWDVTHEVARFNTPYPAADTVRTKNLQVGAQRVNGTVVMPGEEFNLNSLLSPVTAANGYFSSGVVESGVSTTAMGGGLSQIATMAYNAGFLGGMEIVEHKPHSRWFDRYPMGRESTYWENQINVRWKNDTNAPVIVEMWLADSKVHTRLWGANYYKVSTTTTDPYNYTGSPTIHSDAADCIPERGGKQGFTVDVKRTKTPVAGGKPVQESWSWAYTGWPRVICE